MKPGKGSKRKGTPAIAQLHHNGNSAPVDRVLTALGDYAREGDGWVALCPSHNDSKPSLRISQGDDGRALLTCRAGCSSAKIVAALGVSMADLFSTAGSRLKKRDTRALVTMKRAQPKKPTRVAELTADQWAEARREAKRVSAKSAFSGYKLTALYPYRKVDGSIWCWRSRFEHPSKDKEISPFHFDGQQWIAKEPKAPRAGKPLYRLPELLATDETVFVVEGEKCADALASVGIVTTTSGSSSTAKGADWSPLAGRVCVIWPDNDDAGDRYAADVATRLADLGCEVSIVDVGALDLPNKGDDAADWMAMHRKAKAADVLALPTLPPELDEGPSVQLVCAADIQPKSIHWLWKGWMARGMLHIVAGDGGTGKTTTMLTLAAAITTGGKLPDGSTAPVGNVLVWTGEDDVERVLVPRLDEAGADRRRVFIVRGVNDGEGSRPFDPAIDMRALESQAARIGNVVMVLVDPIVNAVAGDSHKNAEVRRGLQPLVDLGARLQAAVVGITHFAKNTEGRKTTDRIIGSVAYSNLSRVAMVAVKGKSGECRLVRCKSNIGPDGDGFSYAIDIVQRDYDGVQNDVSRIGWGVPLFGYATELLDQVEAKRLARDDAADWLSARLADGPAGQKELAEQAKADGMAWRTIERAKDTLGVIAYPERTKGKGRGNGRWMWELPRSRGVSERMPGRR